MDNVIINDAKTGLMNRGTHKDKRMFGGQKNILYIKPLRVGEGRKCKSEDTTSMTINERDKQNVTLKIKSYNSYVSADMIVSFHGRRSPIAEFENNFHPNR